VIASACGGRPRRERPSTRHELAAGAVRFVDGHATHGLRCEVGLDPRADLRRIGGAAARAASPTKTAGATRAASPALGQATAEPAARAAETTAA
jgi:hypothetical protein